jgi:hypothetical protein
MKKLTFLLVSLFLLFGCSKKEDVKIVEKKRDVIQQTFPTTYFSPSNIIWTKDPVPDDLKNNKQVKKWLQDVLQEEISYWSYVSLLDDKNQEVILVGSHVGTGGTNFLIMTKTPQGWKELTSIFGGFIYYPVPSKNHTLVVYEKSGTEYYRTESKFDGSRYKRISSYEVPIELTRLNGSPINFYQFFWFMNGDDRE